VHLLKILPPAASSVNDVYGLMLLSVPLVNVPRWRHDPISPSNGGGSVAVAFDVLSSVVIRSLSLIRSIHRIIPVMRCARNISFDPSRNSFIILTKYC